MGQVGTGLTHAWSRGHMNETCTIQVVLQHQRAVRLSYQHNAYAFDQLEVRFQVLSSRTANSAYSFDLQLL